MTAPVIQPGTAEVIKANALDLPLPDESVDLIITSPPYFALRSYQDGGEHYDGQIGSEETPQQFLDALWAAMAECWRVLKPSGSAWVNLGDKYVSGTTAAYPDSAKPENRKGTYATGGKGLAIGQRVGGASAGHVRTKSLMGLPWRFAIGCIDGKAAPNGQQWILRAEVVWDKPNGLPESVTDRVRRSHEQWFHFVKSPRYFAAVDEVREPQVKPVATRDWGYDNKSGEGERHRSFNANQSLNPLGKLPGSVWRIPSEPLKVPEELGIDHFAAFPTDKKEETAWLGKIGLCRTCSGVKAAGLGPDGLTQEATASTTSQVQESSGSTDSPMSYGPAQFLQDSPSTTYVETPVASTPHISKPLRDEKTSSERNVQDLSALTDTISRLVIATVTDAVGNAACVCENERGGTTPASEPSVWRVATEPLKVPAELGIDHFAAFPTEFPRRIILGWSPSGICVECGDGLRPVVAAQKVKAPAHGAGSIMGSRRSPGDIRGWDGLPRFDVERNITGYACACPEGLYGPPRPGPQTTPAVILDPFGGTGTVAMVAKALGRHGISVDLSADYCRLAEWRTNDPQEIRDVQAKTYGIKREAPNVIDGQIDLFGDAS